MKNKIIGKYKHFKGQIVGVLGVAKHSENHNDLYVVYTHPDENGKDQMWIRPKKMFLETIERDKKMMRRFEKLD